MYAAKAAGRGRVEFAPAAWSAPDRQEIGGAGHWRAPTPVV